MNVGSMLFLSLATVSPAGLQLPSIANNVSRSPIRWLESSTAVPTPASQADQPADVARSARIQTAGRLVEQQQPG